MTRVGGVLPRSVLPLGALLLLAGIWYLAVERPRSGPAAGAGGPLLPFPAADLIRLEVRHATADLVELARDAPGGLWRLEGAEGDWVDPESMTGLIDGLGAEMAGPVLAEDEAPLSRSELGLTFPAVELMAAAGDGRRLELAIGARNPVLELHYAQGGGRPGVFLVTPRLVRLLSNLPDGVRLLTLFPRFDSAAIETVAVRPTGAKTWDVFARDSTGAWWLRAPAGEEGRRRSGTVHAAYQRLYNDRRRDEGGEGGAVWWRAQDRVLRGLIFEAGLTNVHAFGPRRAPAETLAAHGLLPRPLTVRLAGAAGRPLLRAELGAPLAATGQTPALRDGRPHVLIVSRELRVAASQPLAEWLDLDALPWEMAQADSFRVRRAGLPEVGAWRSPEGWRLRRPSAAEGAAARAGAALGDLVHYLDMMPIIAPLPPVAPGASPLLEAQRIAIDVWAAGEKAPRRVEIGLLEDRADAAAHFPDDGKLLAVPREIVTTIRSMFAAVGIL